MTHNNASSGKSDAPDKLAMRDINPDLYRHPGEAGALGRLEKAPGFAKLLDLMSDHGGGQAERLVELASMAKVGPGVYPALDKLWRATLADFGIGDVPLHVTGRDSRGMVLKGGHAGPRVIVSVDLLDELSKEQMAALLAMAAGSVRLGNVVNLTAAEFLRWVQDFYGVFGAPAYMLSWALENWRRYAAMSSDRAAALYCGEEAVRSLLALWAGAGSSAWGGINDEDRLRLQGVEAASRDQDWESNRWRRFMTAMNRKNSAALVRRLDLADWYASGAPEKILAGEARTPEDLDMDGVRTDSPGILFWGAYASGTPEAEEPGWRETAESVKELAEKGVGGFLKAGEAFFRALRDEMK